MLELLLDFGRPLAFIILGGALLVAISDRLSRTREEKE